MRGTTLERLIDMLRIEARLSINPAHNTNDRQQQVEHLQRVQEWLWEDFTWPHLRVERTLAVSAGQRYYSLPSDMSIERIEAVEVFRDGRWMPVEPGIGGVQYSIHNSDLGEQDGLPRNWRLTEDEKIEVWPIPELSYDIGTQEGVLKVRGIRNLRPLVDGGDVADIDDRLIVLFCAAEKLGATGAKDAKLKQDQALKRYATLKGNLSTIRGFTIGKARPAIRNRFGHLQAGLGQGGEGSGGASSGTGSGSSTGTRIQVTVDGGRRS